MRAGLRLPVHGTQRKHEPAETADSAAAEKYCASCGRRFTRRRRWQTHWQAVRHCSRACSKRGLRTLDRELENAVLRLLAVRARGATICPSEAARSIADATPWRELMEPARCAVRRLARRGLVEVTQGGQLVDGSDFRGPIRVRAAG